ncbi:DnaJ-domain-containing protein [Phellopilus nigrolimitatus]|nr:DnaJ-domain-containing protein [Phellopilus nigrolimitatus]
MASTFPDYYALLGIQSKATQDEIRQAYKKESLRSHPDRLVNAPAEERKHATETFQASLGADAYYVLSDPTRRKEYNSLRSARASNERTSDPSSSADFFANFANMFTGAAAGSGAAGAGPDAGAQQRPDAEGVFSDVFEELLRPEVDRVVPWWAWVGALCGAGLGFIIANIPGLLIGGFAGNRLGSVRDAKGKSVAAVFSQLGGNQKAEVNLALPSR